MAAMKSIVKEVEDITECPICTEMYCNPKMLPCFHTFCLKCIEQYCKDKEEGDAMPCPMCRREFAVPAGGLSKLSINFFIERLIAAQHAPVRKEVVNCDVCLLRKQCKIEASSFCEECHENLCDSCSNMHKKMKITITHNLSTIRDVPALETNRNKIRPEFCDEHPTEEIVKFFCRECKMPFCATSFIAKHNKHDCCEIGEMFEELKVSFMNYSGDVSELLTDIKTQSDQVDENFASFAISINTAEKSILERSEAIIQMVERHTRELLQKLGARKQKYMESIENTKEELRRYAVMCENFLCCCQEAIDKADTVESIRLADELESMVEELAEKPIPKFELPDIQFHPSNLDVATNLHDMFGHIHVKYSLDICPQGFDITKDELFCIFAYIPDIHVYSIEPFTFKRTITVDGLGRPWDIVAGENVLYVYANEDRVIHRIQLPDETVSKWSADCGTQFQISISKNDNVIAAGWDKIIEYTPTGNVVREIKVNHKDLDFIGLHHALQLDRNKFLVCHDGETHHRVCIIDIKGRVVQFYGRGSRGADIGQLNRPYHLAIDRNGFILVADKGNNRVVKLSASLEYVNEFTGFNQPIRLRRIEELGRLYVMERSERRITIMDM